MIRDYTARTLATLRQHPLTIFLVLATFGGAMLLSVAAYASWNIEPAQLFRDANAVSKSPHWYGLFSQLGIIIWSMAAGVLLLTLILGRLTSSDRWYVTYSLAFTIILLLDDTYQLHEKYSPHYITVDYLHVVYVGMIGAYFLLFRKQLLHSPLILLVLALTFFGGSLVFDAAPNRDQLVPPILVYYIEDGFKLLGLCFWSMFYLLHSRQLLQDTRQQPITAGSRRSTDRSGQMTQAAQSPIR